MQHIDAVDRGDRISILNRLGCLDHRHQKRLFVEDLADHGLRDGGIAELWTAAEGRAVALRGVETGFDDRPGLGRRFCTCGTMTPCAPQSKMRVASCGSCEGTRAIGVIPGKVPPFHGAHPIRTFRYGIGAGAGGCAERDYGTSSRLLRMGIRNARRGVADGSNYPCSWLIVASIPGNATRMPSRSPSSRTRSSTAASSTMSH